MTEDEKSIYGLTRFAIGDLVEIDESELIGEVVGMQIKIGCEDSYLLSYHDACGNPQRTWWPGSSLEPIEDDENGNVICFSCAKAALEATKH